MGCGDGRAGAGVRRRRLRGFWEEPTGWDRRASRRQAFEQVALWAASPGAQGLRPLPWDCLGAKVAGSPSPSTAVGVGGWAGLPRPPQSGYHLCGGVTCAPGASHPASHPPLGWQPLPTWHLALGWWAGCDGGAPGGGRGPPGFPWGALLSTRLPPLLPQGGPGKGGPTCQSAGVLASQAPRGWVL